MARHVSTDILNKSTPPEWLGVAAGVGHNVQMWANRTDLFTMLSPQALPGGVVAHFTPKSAEVHLDLKKAFGEIDPTDVPDLRRRPNQYDYAAPLGAAFHEAMHAKHSTMDLDYMSETLDRKVMDAMFLLEESRIEGLGVKSNPRMRPFVRVFVNKLIMGELTKEFEEQLGRVGQAAHSCAIVLARVDAGVLKPKDANGVRELIVETLGEELVAKLRALWCEFQGIKDATAGYNRMVHIATEWVELVKEAAKDEQQEQSESGEGPTAEQLADAAEFLQKLGEALEEAGASVSTDAYQELADQESEERAEEAADEAKRVKEEYDQHKDAAQKVFDHKDVRESGSKIVSQRDPKPEERAAAVTVGRALDKAKYRDRVKVVGNSKLPPGRLKMRSVLAGEAAKARGVTADIEPWRRVSRHHVDDPNLTVGMMVDISGSMGEAMQPMATAAWVMSEAIRRIQGTAAMVYYGGTVKPALKPGEHLEKVQVHSARDGSEDFDGGFKALDGALNLLHGRGARLLVIVSDGNYTDYQVPLCQKWLARCKQAGVAVLWIGYGNTAGGGWGGGGAEALCADGVAEFVRPSGQITDDALLIGRAGEKALSLIGSRT